MLRITFQDTRTAVVMKLEGRVAGPWANELDRVWVEIAPKLPSKKLVIDLRNVTYADAAGKAVLGKIYARTNADFLTAAPSSQFLAEEITLTNTCNS